MMLNGAIERDDPPRRHRYARWIMSDFDETRAARMAIIARFVEAA
jgi:hypothetical protein